MKTKALLTVLTLGIFMSAFAQKPTITLTFTADSSGQHVTLNSILIENLTQGGDTTLYAPDTVLLLSYIAGIDEEETTGGNIFSISQNYPNPMEGSTTLDLYLPGTEEVMISVSDILGRELIDQEYRLTRGNHSFTFYAGRESLYFLTARVNQQSRTIKMFNKPSLSSLSGNCKLEYGGILGTPEGHKAAGVLNDFVFNLGDQLRYTASSTLGVRTLLDKPTGNQTYTFQYGSGGIPCPGMPTVTYGGQVYNTVLIGTQCWLKENMNIGTRIIGSEEQTNNGMIEKYCNNDDDAKCAVYGGLYQWDEMMQYLTQQGIQGICPSADGWHIPSDAEWTALTDYLDVESGAGGKMKEAGYAHWASPNTGATNESGFTALPGGYRHANGDFYNLAFKGLFWSSTEFFSDYAWSRILYYDSASVSSSFDSSKYRGYSVRCLRD